MSALTVKDIDAFRGRPTLRLEGCDTLEALKDAPDLEVLALQHFPKITSLEPLRSLANLRYLSLSTTIGWDGTNRHLVVDSFEPLVALKKLECLQLLGVVPEHDRLEPISRITSLTKLSIGNTSFYQVEDFAALSVSLPKARRSLRPVSQMNFVSMCRRCRQYPLLFLEGAKPRTPRYVCPSCGRKKIVAHLERWNRAGGLPQFPRSETAGAEDLLKEFGNPDAT